MHPQSSSYKYIVGIDLGTTHTAVSYSEKDSAKTETFFIPQKIEEGVEGENQLLPSVVYISGEKEYFAGRYARTLGLQIPTRGVFSAKSWLNHTRQKGDEAFLPFESASEKEKISPISALAVILEHVHTRWDQKYPQYPLKDQKVIVTCPASFNEQARFGVVKACQAAGLKTPLLIEEPLAAFYAFKADEASRFKTGETILVVDIGGGTTDFCLIEKTDEGFQRQEVGEHLLLGGDNMDLALAHYIESKLGGEPLDSQEWLKLVAEARKIKEILSQSGQKEARVSFLGKHIIKSARSAVIHEEEFRKILIDGFFPFEEYESAYQAHIPTGLKKGGLNYQSEPSILRHLARFLSRTKRVPDYVLFNGGVFKYKKIGEALSHALNRWFNKSVAVLPAKCLDQSVARGAVRFGLSLEGVCEKIKSGLVRSYYLETMTEQGPKALTIVERGTEEGTEKIVDIDLKALPNTFVSIPLWSSQTRLDDSFLSIVPISDEDMILDLPRSCFLKYGKSVEPISVAVKVSVTQMGTLSLKLFSKISNHEWDIAFETREGLKKAFREQLHDKKELESIGELIKNSFESNDPKHLAPLMRNIEALAGQERANFSLSLLRSFWTPLKECEKRRKAAPLYEERWWNLAGLSLMPGLGYALDDVRMKELWKIYLSDARFTREKLVALRRVALGLNTGQQLQVYSAALKISDPALHHEKIRLIGALELIPTKEKEKWIKNLIEENNPAHAWTLARLGARKLISDSFTALVCKKELAFALEKLMERGAHAREKWGLVFREWLRHTGIREIDLPKSLKERVLDFMTGSPLLESLQKVMYQENDMNTSEEEELFGDSLPLGIHL